MGKGSDTLGLVSGYEIQGPRQLYRGEASRRIVVGVKTRTRFSTSWPPLPSGASHRRGLPRDIAANSGLSVSATTETYQAQFRGF
jgi:hypothetical protein